MSMVPSGSCSRSSSRSEVTACRRSAARTGSVTPPGSRRRVRRWAPSSSGRSPMSSGTPVSGNGPRYARSPAADRANGRSTIRPGDRHRRSGSGGRPGRRGLVVGRGERVVGQGRARRRGIASAATVTRTSCGSGRTGRRTSTRAAPVTSAEDAPRARKTTSLAVTLPASVGLVLLRRARRAPGAT